VQQIQHHPLLRPGQRPGRFRPWAGDRGRRSQTGSPSFHRGARNPNRGANCRGHATDRRQRHDSGGQGTPPSGAIGIPSRSASFLDDNYRFRAGEAPREMHVILS
jgi:hypothetical protein